MKLATYVVRRLLILIPTLLGVTLITFVLAYAPGTAQIVAQYCNPKGPGGCGINPPSPQVQAIIQQLHLDAPIPVQYAYYVQGLLQGNWGWTKTASNQILPVTQAVVFLFPATVELAITSTVLAVVLGIPTGTLSAIKKDKLPDHVTRVVALSGYSIPVFWLGLILEILVITFLPGSNYTAGMYNPTNAALIPQAAPWAFVNLGSVDQPTWMLFSQPTHFFILDAAINADWPVLSDAIAHIILPTLTLGFGIFGVILRMVRSGMVDAMSQDYVRTAWAKGLPEEVVIRKHIRRNALLPTTTVIGLTFAGLLGGVVLVEDVFAWPGIGNWAAQSILRYDVGGVLGTTLLFALFLMLINLVVDITYAYLDPRISL